MHCLWESRQTGQKAGIYNPLVTGLVHLIYCENGIEMPGSEPSPEPLMTVLLSLGRLWAEYFVGMTNITILQNS